MAFDLSSIFNGAYTTARQNAIASATAPAAATEKAPAAPKGTTNAAFTGLCQALNAHQKQLVDKGDYEFADVYEIKFDPPELMNLKIRKPGSTVQGATAMQQKDAKGGELNPETNSVNKNSQAIQVPFGKQIVQVIEEILRASEFVTAQQVAVIDPLTGKVTQQATTPNGQTAWFKISAQTTPIGKKQDSIRKDYAYKITYLITPFSISAAPSDWFPKSKFRGVHKNFNYWFTGKNTQILNYEQSYNILYSLTMSDQSGVARTGGTINDSRELYAKTFATRSGESDSGSASNEPGANLAEALYNSSDFIEIRMRIVGDPAFMQQGEVVGGIVTNFNYAPFNTDGTINFDAGEVLFDVSWNRPQDYNLSTGLMDVNAKNVSSGGQSLPQENQTYRGVTVKSMFNKGMFTQDLHGSLLLDFDKNSFNSTAPTATAASAAAASASNSTTAPQTAAAPPLVAPNNPLQQAKDVVGNPLGAVGSFLRNPLGSLGSDAVGRTQQSASPPAATTDSTTSPLAGQTPPVAPVSLPKPATSDGGIVSYSSATSSSTPASSSTLPAQTASPSVSAVTNLPPPPSVLPRNIKDVIFGNNAASGVQTKVNTTPPQKIAKD